MSYVCSVCLTPAILVFLGLPLALKPAIKPTTLTYTKIQSLYMHGLDTGTSSQYYISVMITLTPSLRLFSVISAILFL